MNYKYSFQNDYSDGGHPDILLALSKTNLLQEFGYGDDSFCKKAAELIKNEIKNPLAAIHFVSGGTQANLLSLASMMKSYESVIAATTAHISIHEAGAIEATGHKINAIQSTNGKITSQQILDIVNQHTDEHMVKPKVVFISQSTELGTLYTKEEIMEISVTCKNNNLYLYLDGARLGSGLVAAAMTLPELSEMVDMFYIGGTKNGALLGEAIVINNPQLQENFRFYLKQRGALLAKGRVLGIQFIELFTNSLYFKLAKHANEIAAKLTKGITSLGYTMLTNSKTNQIFPVFSNTLIEKLGKMYGFYTWRVVAKNNSAIRLVTSWATKEEAVDEFLSDLKSL